MIEVRPFRWPHLQLLDVQEYQRAARDVFHLQPQAPYIEDMQSFTVFDGERPLACGGVFALAPWRGFGWTLLARDIGHKFVHVHRFTRRLCDLVPFRRIELEVDCEFEAGHRWARALGFELETQRVRKYREDGGDITRYVLIK